MRVNARTWRAAGCGLLFVLSFASLAAAASDLRLVEAAKAQNKTAVRALLTQQIDVNTRQPDGATALHWAAQRGNLEIADLLMRAGADAGAADGHGVTPLLLASTDGNTAMVEKLLAAGANPNAASTAGETPLMSAARSGAVPVLKALFARGADVNAKEPSRGQTALMWASAEKHSDVVRLLIEAGADVRARTKGGFTPLLFAAREGGLDVARILLAAGANVNELASDGSGPLLVATVRGHLPVATFLLEHGADPNVDKAGYTPLHWAAGAWDGSLTGIYGIQSESNEWSALGGLRGAARLEFVKLLLARSAKPNARTSKAPPRFGFTQFNDIGDGGRRMLGATPLLFAAMAGDVDVKRALVQAGADPNHATDENTTLVMIAAGTVWVVGESRVTESDALKAVQLALELGGDVNDVNDTGDTALHAAAYMGADTIVQFLVDKGAKVDPENYDGVTPWMIAAGKGPRMAGTNISNPSTAALLAKLGAKSR